MVTIESIIPWDELVERIRLIPLLHKRDGKVIYPYATATITLDLASYATTRTTSLYVAHDLLDMQHQIAEDIAVSGYDALAMDCGLTLRTVDDWGIAQLTGYIPPIVEVDHELGTYVLDGSHRANLGRWSGRLQFKAIFISGIPKDCPAYAYPNDWEDVIVYDVPPTDPKLRKRYREKGLYSLYRDFSVLNGSRPRYGDI